MQKFYLLFQCTDFQFNQSDPTELTIHKEDLHLTRKKLLRSVFIRIMKQLNIKNENNLKLVTNSDITSQEKL